MKYGTLAIAVAGTIALGFVAVHTVSADEGRRGGYHSGYGGSYGGAHHAHGNFARGHWRGGPQGGPHGGGHQGMAGHFSVFFDMLDIDANNEVSRKEALRPANQRFAVVDADKDGFATAAELATATEANPNRFGENMLDRLDADGDEKISAAEFAVRGRAMFARADANDDGAVSYVEFASLRHDMHERRGRPPEGRGMGRGPMHGGPMQGGTSQGGDDDAAGADDGDGAR